MQQERRGRRPGQGRTGRSCQWRAGFGARRQLGHRREAPSRRRSRTRRPPRARRCPTPTCMQATRDSVRAIMMIRAYRMRGHLHANLDPLGIAKPLEDYNELSPRGLWLHRGRLRPQDLHRQRARARIRHHPRDAGDPDSAPIARRSASSSCTSPIPRRRPGSRSASRARTRDHLHAGGQEGDPEQADRSRRFRAVHRRQVQGHQALRPRRRRSR